MPIKVKEVSRKKGVVRGVISFDDLINFLISFFIFIPFFVYFRFIDKI